jgi:predicted RecA/RadA family phage recombinase
MKTLRHRHPESETFLYTNAGAAAVKSGDVVLIGERYGIAQVDIAVGGSGVVLTAGTVTLTKAAGTALAQGTLLGWDSAAGTVVVYDPAGRTPAIGTVHTSAATAATAVDVTLIPDPPLPMGTQIFQARFTPTAAEATANAVTRNTGFGKAPSGYRLANVIATDGSIRADTTVSFAADGDFTVSNDNLADDDTVEVLVFNESTTVLPAVS